jgi:hypothetical protein
MAAPPSALGLLQQPQASRSSTEKGRAEAAELPSQGH